MATPNATARIERRMNRKTFGRNIISSFRRFRKRALNVGSLAMRAHIDERETGSLTFRLYSHNMLIVFLAYFELDVLAVVAFAGQLVRIVLGTMLTHIHVQVQIRSMAFENRAILFQLVSVKRDDLGGRVSGLVLQGNDFYAVSKARDIDVGALVAAAGIFFLQPGAGINRQTNVGYIRLLADVDSAH